MSQRPLLLLISTLVALEVAASPERDCASQPAMLSRTIIERPASAASGVGLSRQEIDRLMSSVELSTLAHSNPKRLWERLPKLTESERSSAMAELRQAAVYAEFGLLKAPDSEAQRIYEAAVMADVADTEAKRAKIRALLAEIKQAQADACNRSGAK